jgi:hypothetical protein
MAMLNERWSKGDVCGVSTCVNEYLFHTIGTAHSIYRPHPVQPQNIRYDTPLDAAIIEEAVCAAFASGRYGVKTSVRNYLHKIPDLEADAILSAVARRDCKSPSKEPSI